MTGSVTVVQVGWATTVQDAGRTGMAHLGVPGAGPVDRPLAGLVNRLVGNPSGSALFETFGGLEIRADTAILLACSISGSPFTMRRGEHYVVAHDPRRNFHYLAVRGGLELEVVLGSASHDTLSGLGPPTMVAGGSIAVGDAVVGPVVVDVAPVAPPGRRIRLWPGPRLGWFAPGTFDRILAAPWRPSAQLSRVGVRLDGPQLERAVGGELPSEGLVLGAVQIPHDGRPVVMLADHPTTGGYPVAAVVDPRDLADLAQCPPGQELRFVSAT